MTSSRGSRTTLTRLLRNSGWNLLGQGTGVLVAAAAIPMLLSNLGLAAFGLFTIFWALVGYSGLLDLGIGRAVTVEVAKHTLRNDQEAIAGSVAAATSLLALVALLLSILLVTFADQIVGLLVWQSPELISDCLGSIRVLSLTVPVVLLTGLTRGALEGLQEFKAINKVAMLTGSLMFAVPAGVSMLTTAVSDIVWSLLAVRAATFILLNRVCRQRIPNFRLRLPTKSEVRTLLGAGGWMTVSNAISPLMNNLDRLFISARLSPAAAALYVTPYELATKLLLPAGSIANAAFPEFAKQSIANGQEKAERRRYFWRAVFLTSGAALLPSLVVIAFAENILALWISVEFSRGISTDILRLLSVGVILNGAAYIPFAFIQGIGRADIAAKFHILELLIFIPALLYSLSAFGVIGAAMVWVGRVLLDAVLLFAVAIKSLA